MRKVSGFGHLVPAQSQAVTGCPNFFLAKNFLEMSHQCSRKVLGFGYLVPAQSKVVTGYHFLSPKIILNYSFHLLLSRTCLGLDKKLC